MAMCTLYVFFLISQYQYNDSHFFWNFVLEQIPGFFFSHCALWWSLPFHWFSTYLWALLFKYVKFAFYQLKMWISCIFTLQAVTAVEEVSCVNCSIYPQETLLSVEQTQLYNV